MGKKIIFLCIVGWELGDSVEISPNYLVILSEKKRLEKEGIEISKVVLTKSKNSLKQSEALKELFEKNELKVDFIAINDENDFNKINQVSDAFPENHKNHSVIYHLTLANKIMGFAFLETARKYKKPVCYLNFYPYGLIYTRNSNQDKYKIDCSLEVGDYFKVRGYNILNNYSLINEKSKFLDGIKKHIESLKIKNISEILTFTQIEDKNNHINYICDMCFTINADLYIVKHTSCNGVSKLNDINKLIYQLSSFKQNITGIGAKTLLLSDFSVPDASVTRAEKEKIRVIQKVKNNKKTNLDISNWISTILNPPVAPKKRLPTKNIYFIVVGSWQILPAYENILKEIQDLKIAGQKIDKIYLTKTNLTVKKTNNLKNIFINKHKIAVDIVYIDDITDYQALTKLATQISLRHKKDNLTYNLSLGTKYMNYAFFEVARNYKNEVCYLNTHSRDIKYINQNITKQISTNIPADDFFYLHSCEISNSTKINNLPDDFYKCVNISVELAKLINTSEFAKWRVKPKNKAVDLQLKNSREYPKITQIFKKYNLFNDKRLKNSYVTNFAMKEGDWLEFFCFATLKIIANQYEDLLVGDIELGMNIVNDVNAKNETDISFFAKSVFIS